MADVTIGGVRLHVQRLGGAEGTPVVFLHGLVMDNLSSWYFTVANAVAVHRPVLLYDLRGHGRSERPTGGYRLQDLVEELRALLEHEGIERATIVGHSFGGTLGIAFAKHYEDHIESLILLDALIPDVGWGERMVSTLRLTGEDRNSVIAERFQSWLGRHSERKRSRLAKGASALIEGTRLLDDIAESESFDDFSDLHLPVRLLQGRHSDVRPQGEHLAAECPNSEIAWFDGTHSLLWEDTDAVRAQLLRWLVPDYSE